VHFLCTSLRALCGRRGGEGRGGNVCAVVTFVTEWVGGEENPRICRGDVRE